MIDGQIETVRGADQYQLLKINVSYPVDLLTPGFQFEAIERNVFRCSQMGRLRPSVLSRQEINSDSGESRGRPARGCDTDGSTIVRVRDRRRT